MLRARYLACRSTLAVITYVRMFATSSQAVSLRDLCYSTHVAGSSLHHYVTLGQIYQIYLSCLRPEGF